MLDGKLHLELPGGEVAEAELKAGIPYYRAAGVEHDVVNANDYEFVFVETELK
jgi:beta-alanine degradation protein BauB